MGVVNKMLPTDEDNDKRLLLQEAFELIDSYQDALEYDPALTWEEYKILRGMQKQNQKQKETKTEMTNTSSFNTFDKKFIAASLVPVMSNPNYVTKNGKEINMFSELSKIKEKVDSIYATVFNTELSATERGKIINSDYKEFKELVDAITLEVVSNDEEYVPPSDDATEAIKE